MKLYDLRLVFPLVDERAPGCGDASGQRRVVPAWIRLDAPVESVCRLAEWEHVGHIGGHVEKRDIEFLITLDAIDLDLATGVLNESKGCHFPFAHDMIGRDDHARADGERGASVLVVRSDSPAQHADAPKMSGFARV